MCNILHQLSHLANKTNIPAKRNNPTCMPKQQNCHHHHHHHHHHRHSPAVTNDVICFLPLHGKTESQFIGTLPEVWFNAIFTFEIFPT